MTPRPRRHTIPGIPAPAEGPGIVGIGVRDRAFDSRDARLPRGDEGGRPPRARPCRDDPRHGMHPRRRGGGDGDGPQLFNLGGCAVRPAGTRADLWAERVSRITWTAVSGSIPAAPGSRTAQKLTDRCRSVILPTPVPVATSRAASRGVVPFRLSSWVRVVGWPGAGGRGVCVRPSAGIGGVASTASTPAGSGGVLEGPKPSGTVMPKRGSFAIVTVGTGWGVRPGRRRSRRGPPIVPGPRGSIRCPLRSVRRDRSRVMGLACLGDAARFGRAIGGPTWPRCRCVSTGPRQRFGTSDSTRPSKIT